MPYPIDQKLVIAVASSALFDLKESDAGAGDIPMVHIPFGISNYPGK